MRLKALWLAPFAVLPLAAEARGLGHIDAYYIPSADLKIDVSGLGGADDSGDGWGGRVSIPVSATAAIVGEYQETDYDDFDLGTTQFRGGLAMFFSPTSGLIVEYVDIDLESNDGDEPADGFAGHVHIGFPAGDAAEVYGRVGYAKLEDDSGEKIEGLEWSVGIAVDLNPNMGGFIDFRSSRLETADSGVDFQFDDLRIGLRFPFN